MTEIKINYLKCDNCGECTLICPEKIFQLKNNKITINNPQKCTECHACEITCHKKAITIIEEE